MIETTATILSNDRAAKGQYLLSLKVEGLSKTKIIPGQFCMLSTGGGTRLLRRPFSVHSRPGPDRVTVLYKVAGEGTAGLSRKKKNEKLSLLLPLGNGFPLKELEKKHLTIVAGGIGVASVMSLLDVKSLSKKFFYGARTKEELCETGKKKKAGFFFATDDGSKGYKGLVTDLVVQSVTKDLTSIPGRKMAVCACGPMPMLKTLFKNVSNTDSSIDIYFALEEKMACGFGVCQGCVVATRDGYRRTCKDGPVFPARQIYWPGN